MNDDARSRRAWWGDYSLEVGQTGRWRIGPFHLNMYRLAKEWKIAHASLGDFRDETTEIEVPAAAEPPAVCMSVIRYIFRDSPASFSLSPMLADRPVIVKPVAPLYVPAGEEVTLFVGCPVTLRLTIGSLTHELPTHRPSDTWMGPNTREGELCYASTTLAQLDLDDCTIRPHRAITSIEVKNDGSDALLVERIRLPAPHLALYRTEGNALWTQSVTLVRVGDGASAALWIGDVSKVGGVLQRLAEPREAPSRNIMTQTFSRLFG